MDKTVYIFGHQNPDTDSICSAISYSYLKNTIDPKNNYIPISLKEVNKETEFVLNYFNIAHPKIQTNLKPQVSDINFHKIKSVHEYSTVKQTLNIIKNIKGRAVPVADKNGRLIGIISIANILPIILMNAESELLWKMKTPLKNLVAELSLKEASLDHKHIYEKVHSKEDNYVNGRVFLSTDLLSKESYKALNKQDIVICNKLEWSLYVDIVGGVIVGSVVSDAEIQELKEEFNLYYKANDKDNNHCAFLYYSNNSIFELAKTLAQAVPISPMVAKKGLEYFVTYETLDDVQENLASSKHKSFPVVDENGLVVGVLSRSDIMNINRKKAILVDHNERGQSIDGIEDIDILEIIDHHRVADISTISPLYFRVEPVGCTSTIITKMYDENNVEIPPDMAGLMLSAIISDTLLFNSPTCTQLDIDTAKRLAKIANINYKAYGMKMLTAGSEVRAMSPYKIINTDRKKFMFGKYKVSITQINSGDFDYMFSIYDDLIEIMETGVLEDGFDLFVLLLTDVVVGGTEIMAYGPARWIVENAFDMAKDDKSKFLPDIFSRKKQVVPRLMNAAKL